MALVKANTLHDPLNILVDSIQYNSSVPVFCKQDIHPTKWFTSKYNAKRKFKNPLKARRPVSTWSTCQIRARPGQQ